MSGQLSSLRWAAMASLILLTGCTGGGTAIGPPEQTTVTVDAFGAIDTAGLFIAQQDGLFARQGLTVKLRPQVLIQPQVDDLLQGKADIASGDYVTFIENQTGGDPDPGLGGKKPDLRIISESSFLQPNVLELVTTPRSATTSVTALRGKAISVLGPRNVGDILVFALLQTHGIPVSQVRFPNVPFPAIGDAFTARKMDAAFAPEPFVTLLAEGAGMQELADLDQGATENFPIQGMVTTGTWARAHPNTVRRFLAAYNRGQAIAATNRAAVERALETFLHLDPVAASLVSLPAFPVGVNPIRLQRTVDAMLQFGMLSQRFRHFDIRSMIGTG
jgi:NitT/TauT family transport system substrate-binding protein